jgi:hypothetical protein
MSYHAYMALDIHALARYGAQARLSELVEEMDSILKAFPDLGKATARPTASTRGRKLSEETKAKMRASWAKRKSAAATQTPATAEAAPKKKRTMTAAGKAAIAAAQKRRWAKIKAGKKR